MFSISELILNVMTVRGMKNDIIISLI
jgi:hypothetical protein